MKSLIRAVVFCVTVVPCMSHMSEGDDAAQVKKEKEQLRKFFSFQLNHTDKKPETVKLTSDKGSTCSLFDVTLENSGYSETETLALSIKPNEGTHSIGCYRSNSERVSTEAYDQAKAEYSASIILPLCVKQKKLTSSGQNPLETVVGCLGVIASGYKVPKEYEYFTKFDESLPKSSKEQKED